MLFGGPRSDSVGDLLNQITSFFGGILDSPVVQLGIRAIAIYVVILWLAAAYWAFRDMQLRTANPILPYFAASIVILFTPVFFPFAIVAYRVVRPQEKIGEVYERTLAEEALLAEVEAVKSCPTCARRVNEEWIICPTCRTRLNRVCPNCSRLVGLDWSLCAWCGRDFERAVQGFEAIAPPRPATRPAPEPAVARPAPAPALESATYRSPAPPPAYRDLREARDTAGSGSLRSASFEAPTRDGGGRDVPPVSPRQPQSAPQALAGPQAMAAPPPQLAAAYDPSPSPSRALDRGPQPPTATHTTSQGPARTARPAPPTRSVKGAKEHASTDALPER